MKNSKGFSLVELIVVIAIMAVLTSMIGIGISVVVNRRVSAAAQNTKEILQAAQQVAMSKQDCYVEISYNSNGETVVTAKSDGKVFDSYEINDKIQVYAIWGGAESPVLIDSHDTVRIYWVRSSGAFKECEFHIGATSVSMFYCDGLQFVKGSKTVTLDFARQTGRITVR